MQFPFQSIRPSQKQLMDDFAKALSEKRNLIAHAPTGLGKTVGTLSVAIPFAIENNLTIFFLTNRHTQHKIAIETINMLGNIKTASIIGKKWLCLQENVSDLPNREFIEFCKAIKEKCPYYNNCIKKNKFAPVASKLLAEIKKAMDSHDIKDMCAAHELCPYYFSIELAKQAQVIIGDYYNVFHPHVQENFFKKANKELSKAILIVDEAHNLPGRIRDMLSSKLSRKMLGNAIYEASKFNFKSTAPIMKNLKEFIAKLNGKVSKEQFLHFIGDDYDNISEQLSAAGDEVRKISQRSYIGSVADFLAGWNGPDEGYLRYAENETLHYDCLDPSLITSDVFHEAYSSVIMSGTLTPMEMFREVFGITAMEKSYSSPFPASNRLSLIVPNITTRYSERSENMFKKIAQACDEINQAANVNAIFFFPSYKLRDEVCKYTSSSNIMLEKPDMKDKSKMLETFKRHSPVVLYAVASASFSEGIDLPGDFLKAVIIVGLPLSRPDVKTTALIDYYQKRFGKGWDYGYIFPAMTKCLQAAGRCIRTETDRGIVIFMDERFLWPKYYQCLPSDWQVEATKNPVQKIRQFLASQS